MKGHSRYGGDSRPQLYLVLWTGAAFLAGVSLGLLGHIPNHIDWGDAATWIGSIATSGALVFAFWQLQSERQTRRSESKAAAQRDARAQAERIAAWFEDDWLYVLNGSQLPISGVALEVTAIWLGGLYESRLILLTTAPPGLVRTPCGGTRSEPVPPWIELSFHDATGKGWVRAREGILTPLEGDTGTYERLLLSNPIAYSSWERVRTDR